MYNMQKNFKFKLLLILNNWSQKIDIIIYLFKNEKEILSFKID